MRLKLIGLCSVCALIFGCVWASVDGVNKKVDSQKLLKNTGKKVKQSALIKPYMPEEKSVWMTEEETTALAKKNTKKSAKNKKYKTSGYWMTEEEMKKSDEIRSQRAARNKNRIYGKELRNLFREPYQRTAEDQRISDARKARKEANNNFDGDIGGLFGDLTQEEQEFLKTVKKVVGYDSKLRDLQDFFKSYEGNINVKDSSFGNTALIISLDYDADEVMRCLIENGADVNLSNNSGDTPLNIAAAKNRQDIVDYLLENGAEINLADAVSGDTPLIVVVRGGFEEMISNLITKGADINQANKLGQTPLMIAVQQADDRVIDILLSEKGINLDVQDKNGYTALMHAVDSNNVEAVKKLVGAGADPEAALNIAQNKNKSEKDNVQKNNLNQKAKFKGALAERAAMLEQQFKAINENRGQTTREKKLNETAEEKAKREKIILILQENAQIPAR